MTTDISSAINYLLKIVFKTKSKKLGDNVIKAIF